MTFDEWLVSEGISSKRDEYYFFTEADCLSAFNAGYTAFTSEICPTCGQTRQHAGGGCIHCITEWCKDKVREAQAERDELKGALNRLYVACPTTLECRHFHHSKRERHTHIEPCGPVDEYLEALNQARAAIAKVRKP